MHFVKFTQFTKPKKKEQMVVRFSVRTDYTEFVGLCWCYVFVTCADEYRSRNTRPLWNMFAPYV